MLFSLQTSQIGCIYESSWMNIIRSRVGHSFSENLKTDSFFYSDFSPKLPSKALLTPTYIYPEPKPDQKIPQSHQLVACVHLRTGVHASAGASP